MQQAGSALGQGFGNSRCAFFAGRSRYVIKSAARTECEERDGSERILQKPGMIMRKLANAAPFPLICARIIPSAVKRIFGISSVTIGDGQVVNAQGWMVLVRGKSGSVAGDTQQDNARMRQNRS